MTIEQFEMILDLTPPRTFVVEWAYILRRMYLETHIEPYNIVAGILSDILEDFPMVARQPLADTPVARLIIHRLLLTNA